MFDIVLKPRIISDNSWYQDNIKPTKKNYKKKDKIHSGYWDFEILKEYFFKDHLRTFREFKDTDSF